MILYTPLSEHDIFPPDPSAYQNQKLLTVKGRTMNCEQMEDGSYRVVQLLSTDPQDYMDSSFYPGTVLSKSEIQG